MARGGVNKAVVQIARTAILARGEHPSIDAVRIEMGNTGSKTTIHRYLKELDEADSRRAIPREHLDDELTELVARLGKAREQLRSEIGKVVVGQHEVIEEVIIALLSRGHCLLEGVPGLAKTLAVKALERIVAEAVDVAPNW